MNTGQTKTVITVTGIRPDFIRMSEVFKLLDVNFNHIMIHTGQHYNKMLSDIFFEELNIREPDYNLGIGGPGKEHFHQSGELGIKLIELIRAENLNPDIILFLGDANTVSAAFPLKKEGYRIGHIEAGMRSYDRRMLEEINRVVCDHCSDILFVYHENYKKKAMAEGIPANRIHVVGNTIVEVVAPLIEPKALVPTKRILLDIHRPENFKNENRLRNIIDMANQANDFFIPPVEILMFPRTLEYMTEFGIDKGNIVMRPLMSFKEYIEAVKYSLFLISDSGTAQEEPALLGTPVIVPRDYTERPESVEHGCSMMLDVNSPMNDKKWGGIIHFVSNFKPDTSWLGDGKTAVKILMELSCYLAQNVN